MPLQYEMKDQMEEGTETLVDTCFSLSSVYTPIPATFSHGHRASFCCIKSCHQEIEKGHQKSLVEARQAHQDDDLRVEGARTSRILAFG